MIVLQTVSSIYFD